MPIINLHQRDGFLVVDKNECRSVGNSLASEYASATPFPHVVLDNFLDSDILRRVVAEFPSSAGHIHYDRAQERLKYQYGPSEWTGAVTNNLFAMFNSAAFIAFLEAMTQFRGLIPDPTYTGGGLHETKRGGHLGVHADFNLHRRLGLIRQLNLLIYLNEGWASEYGGHLELWDTAMTRRVSSIEPVLGRAVVFTTALDAYHGHPEPLSCPPDRSRRSMALYYYTSPPEGWEAVAERTTRYQKRPGTADRWDWKVSALHVANDVTPPLLRRMIERRHKE